MSHLLDGSLRHLCDDSLALSAAEGRHLDICDRCQRRRRVIAQNAEWAAAMLAPEPLRLDLPSALTTLRLQIGAAQRRRPARVNPLQHLVQQCLGGERRPVAPIAAAVTAAAMLVLVLAFTPLGSLAQDVLTVFQPKQFVALPVTSADVQALPNLSDYGTMSAVQRSTAVRVADSDAAAAASGMQVLTPRSLPAGVPATAAYQVLPVSSASFTFSAANAAASAAQRSKSLPAMPPSLDGSTLQATIGPVVVITYGGSAQLPASIAAGATPGTAVHCVLGGLRCSSAHQAPSGAAAGDGAGSSSGSSHLPTLIVAQAPVPAVTSTDATVAGIEDYLLKQPGISPQLAAAIRAIGDPSSTLPIPIPIDMASAKTVQVQGVSGLAIGDITAAGSGVIWQKNGVVYGVAGFLPESEILAIANGLQ